VLFQNGGEVIMQQLKIFALVAILFFSATVARADKVTADFDHTVNFAKFKTFMWINGPGISIPFMKDRVMRSVNQQLTQRGLRQVSDGADLAVSANLATEEKHTWETYYDGAWDWGWGGGGGWATTTERTYEVGTLTVDMFDAQTKKLVWQGVSTDRLHSDPRKNTKDSNKSIEKMFEKFPFGYRESLLWRFPGEISPAPGA
jgi:hypothetical protein